MFKLKLFNIKERGLVERVRIRSYEKGLYFRHGEFERVLEQGAYWISRRFRGETVDVLDQRRPWLSHVQLDEIIRSGELEGKAEVIDLKDHQRALVWLDGRFERVLGPGRYAVLNEVHEVRVEVFDVSRVRFDHPEKNAIIKYLEAGHRYTVTGSGVEQHADAIDAIAVDQGFVGIYYLDGAFVEMLAPGRYLFWKNAGRVKVVHVDTRETGIDVSGQEIMTADKVTLRINAVVNVRVTDARRYAEACEDARQAMYREAQLALRAVVGEYELDALLSDKETVAAALETAVRRRAADFGMTVVGLGIRDVILPGDMKELLNRVIEARKAADANLITRREEVAAMRSQANTAKILENNPTLMRMRELDLLEKIAEKAKLNLVLGEKGLADRIVNLI